jgi:gamma-glutamyl-gamma-aminobutyrate hydrolase PuuD
MSKKVEEVVTSKVKYKYTFLICSPANCQMTQRLITSAGHFYTYDPRMPHDIAIFTGGEDVTPFLYGDVAHVSTSNSLSRDRYDIRKYHALDFNLPKVGICRGAQFLNVMSGGTLWQDVDNHAVNTLHDMVTFDHRLIKVNSTHHQMMRPHDEAWVIATANEATYKRTGSDLYEKGKPYWEEDDSEVVYYGNTNSLCVQYHPEYPSSKGEAREYFFELIDMLFEEEIAAKRQKKAA